MIIYILINVLWVVVTYALLCNSAIIKIIKQNNGKYIYDRIFIIGDIIKTNTMCKLYRFVISVLLFVTPITWIVCVVISGLIIGGYLSGNLEVFGKLNVEDK